MRLPTLATCWLSLISATLALDIAPTASSCIPPGPLLTPQRPDFAACLIKIDNFTDSERAESGCFEDADTGVLTYSGCNDICGSTYSLWEWKDTVDRLSLLVLPTIVLIAHLAFPPLGWWNYFVVMFHAVGNPIGSLRSLLTRLERHRRLRRAAAEVFSGDNLGMRATATVFATYEELSWQDLSGYFSDILIGKRLDPDERALLMRASHRLSSTRLASTSAAAVAIAALVATLASAIVQTINKINEVNTRVYNETTGTIAVVCIMFMSIPQVWFSARLGTFTTNSGASHILETMNDRLKEVITKKGLTNPLFPPLHLATCPLQPQDRRPALLLWLFERLPTSISSYFDSFFSHCPLESTGVPHESENTNFIHAHDKVDYSNYISLNSAWRPCKHLTPDPQGRSHTQLTLISILSVVFGACLPAIFLSLTNHLDQRSLAIGCRALSWIAILGLWLTSFVLDSIFRFFVCRFSYGRPEPAKKVKLLWQWTVAKDAFVTCVVMVVILLVELGRYNSCWCRASFSNPSSVTLFQYSGQQWGDAQIYWLSLPGAGLFVNLVLILMVELRWKVGRGLRLEGGSPLCKTGEEMQGELNELKVLERKDHEQVVMVGNNVPELYDPGYLQGGSVGQQEYGEIGNGRDEGRTHDLRRGEY